MKVNPGLSLMVRAISVFSIVGVCSAAEQPAELLAKQEPKLHVLMQKYQSHLPQLARYAGAQGFVQPVERLATVMHELVHIDSAAHQGYYIDGVYYEPYLDGSAWPALTNGAVLHQLLPAEQSAASQRYATITPQNTLGNVVDEINAYAHVLPFSCRNEPDTAGKQVNLLVGFLNLGEAYLRTLRTRLPEEYSRLRANQASRGALLLVTERAYTALSKCAKGLRIPRFERDMLNRLGA